MAPFLVLVVLFTVLNVLRYLHVPGLSDVWVCLRWALAGMFLFTASAHWGSRRPDLIRMVPPAFPRPAFLVTLTGILEVLGAVGLLIPALARLASLGLILLLIAMFPANIRAAREGLTIGGRPTLALLPRTILQIIFVSAMVGVFLHAGA